MWVWRRKRGVVVGDGKRGRSGMEVVVKRIIRGRVDILGGQMGGLRWEEGVG